MNYLVKIRRGLFIEDVKIKVKMNYSNGIGLHHLELYGKAISETGYRSHFFWQEEIKDIKIMDYLKEFVEFLSKGEVMGVFEKA